jgi:histidinol-phosphate aminotransferase
MRMLNQWRSEMESWRNVIKPGIRNGNAYTFNAKPGIKLDQNESPFDLPAELKQEIFDKIKKKTWNRYSTLLGDPLREALSLKLDVPVERIVVGVGSDEMIHIAMVMVLGKGKTVLYPVPTFPLYNMNARNLEAEQITPHLGDDFSFPVDEILSIIRDKPVELIILTSPNNPTGNSMELSDIEKIVKAAKGLVLIDEAYYEFCGKTALSLHKKYKNCIILRTFSKAFGIAGMRVGYCIADPAVVEYLHKVRLPFSLNIFSETAAITLLEHGDLITSNVAKINRNKDVLIKELQSIDTLKTYPSDTNFFIIDVGKNGPAITNELAQKGIVVRDFSNQPLLENCIRITVGSREDNEKLTRTMKTVCNGEKE